MSFENKNVEKQAQESLEELKNLSQDQLMEKLLHEVAKQKKNGSFNYDGLLHTIEGMKEYLPQTTYRNILNLLEQIK